MMDSGAEIVMVALTDEQFSGFLTALADMARLGAVIAFFGIFAFISFSVWKTIFRE